jgi:hypothetical protein
MKTKPNSKLPESELLHLAEMMLRAIVSGEPLPGCDQPIRFPDLAFVLNQPNVMVVNENILGFPTNLNLSKPVQIVSRQSLLRQAGELGDIYYLHFRRPQIKGDTVQLTLEAKIAPRDPHQPLLGLSGLQVTFKKVDGKWQALGEDRSFAS